MGVKSGLLAGGFFSSLQRDRFVNVATKMMEIWVSENSSNLRKRGKCKITEIWEMTTAEYMILYRETVRMTFIEDLEERFAVFD